jgi:IS5 family transposase
MLGKKQGQMSFGEMETAHRVPEGHFLLKIEKQIDWQPFQEALASLYHPRHGRPGYPPLVLFKALLLQRWYNLSDPGLEEAIRDRLSFQRFLGLSFQDPVPDETTFCRVRGALAQTGLAEQLLEVLEEQLAAKGLLVKRGTLVDATLIQAHSQPPTPEKPSKDQDATWVARPRKRPFFGYKAHLALDQESNLLRRLKLTAGKCHETQMFPEMVLGDEAAVFADKAYDQDCRRSEMRRRGVFCGILAQARKSRPLNDKQRRRNRQFSRIRVAIERVIGSLKWHYGLARFPYVGNIRNHCHLVLVGICFNLKKMLVLQGG